MHQNLTSLPFAIHLMTVDKPTPNAHSCSKTWPFSDICVKYRASHRTNLSHATGIRWRVSDTASRRPSPYERRLVDVSYPTPGATRTIRAIRTFQAMKHAERVETGRVRPYLDHKVFILWIVGVGRQGLELTSSWKRQQHLSPAATSMIRRTTTESSRSSPDLGKFIIIIYFIFLAMASKSHHRCFNNHTSLALEGRDGRVGYGVRLRHSTLTLRFLMGFARVGSNPTLFMAHFPLARRVDQLFYLMSVYISVLRLFVSGLVSTRYVYFVGK